MIEISTILIIEDNERNVKLFTDILEFHGYNVKVALNGAEGYDQVLDEIVDLILLDIQLPDMDGLEVCKSLRENPATSDIPIIAVTSYAMEGDREQALEAGCSDYLTKPIDVELFVETIKIYLQ